MPDNIALIAGATGAAASRLTELLASTPGWQVVGLCRNPPASPPPGVRYIRTDFTDPESCRSAVQQAGAVTHFVYSARAPFGEGGVEDVPANVALLRNLLDAVDTPSLRHAHLLEGGKWYGLHLGPMLTPTQEDDPRHLPPNFYYDQQDLLTERRRGKSWTWSASRPQYLVDVAPGPRPQPDHRGRRLCRDLQGTERAVRFPRQARCLHRAQRDSPTPRCWRVSSAGR